MPKTFLDIPRAAKLAGYSVRQFRRVIEKDEIPVVSIDFKGHKKFFILAAELEKWQRRARP